MNRYWRAAWMTPGIVFLGWLLFALPGLFGLAIALANLAVVLWLCSQAHTLCQQNEALRMQNEALRRLWDSRPR